MPKLKIINLLIIVLIFSGCVGIGAPILSPRLNAQNAEALVDHGRPLPAEELLRITIDQCQKKNDEVGLAYAYKAYSAFLYSSTLLNWKGHYERSGFIDPSVTMDNRYEKSREYLLKAIDLFEKNQEYDALSNAYVHLATIDHFIFDKKQEACEDLVTSLKYNDLFSETHPGVPVNLPKGYASFSDYIDAAKKQFECQ